MRGMKKKGEMDVEQRLMVNFARKIQRWREHALVDEEKEWLCPRRSTLCHDKF